jgi:hypothetical protein
MRIAQALGILSSMLLAIPGCKVDEGSGNCVTFQDDISGQWVVEHHETGLLWMRCPIGQEFDEDSCSCTGEMTMMNLNDAMEACPAGFFFPSDEDMVSVICNLHSWGTEGCPEDVYDSCGECSICNGMFGDDQGQYPSSDLEPTNDPEWEGWMVSFWDFGIACHYWDWDDGSEYVWFNVRCVKDDPAGSDR